MADVRVGAERRDDAQTRRAGPSCRARDGDDGIEVDAAKGRLRAGDLDGRAEGDEDVVDDRQRLRKAREIDDVKMKLARSSPRATVAPHQHIDRRVAAQQQRQQGAADEAGRAGQHRASCCRHGRSGRVISAARSTLRRQALAGGRAPCWLPDLDACDEPAARGAAERWPPPLPPRETSRGRVAVAARCGKPTSDACRRGQRLHRSPCGRARWARAFVSRRTRSPARSPSGSRAR